MKERWFVKDKAKFYIVKQQNGKRDVVFTCPFGYLVTIGACNDMCVYTSTCKYYEAAGKQKEQQYVQTMAKAQ